MKIPVRISVVANVLWFSILDGISAQKKNKISLRQALKITSANSLLGRQKPMQIYKALRQIQGVKGDLAEMGVYKGGGARLIAECVPDRPLYLFDTFEGMPPETTVDVHVAGDFADTSLAEVQALLKGCKNVIFRKGYFPQTAAGLENKIFAFVHVDGDLYQSTVDALHFFYPRMAKGGIMVFDDYKWVHCPGVEKALKEFLIDKPERIIENNGYQATLVKL